MLEPKTCWTRLAQNAFTPSPSPSHAGCGRSWPGAVQEGQHVVVERGVRGGGGRGLRAAEEGAALRVQRLGDGPQAVGREGAGGSAAGTISFFYRGVTPLF